MNSAQLHHLTQSPARMRAPLAWLQADATPTAFRACFLCAHGANEGIERVCTHPELLDFNGPQSVAIVRAWGGGCGPDADRMCHRAVA